MPLNLCLKLSPTRSESWRKPRAAAKATKPKPFDISKEDFPPLSDPESDFAPKPTRKPAAGTTKLSTKHKPAQPTKPTQTAESQSSPSSSELAPSESGSDYKPSANSESSDPKTLKLILPLTPNMPKEDFPPTSIDLPATDPITHVANLQFTFDSVPTTDTIHQTLADAGLLDPATGILSTNTLSTQIIPVASGSKVLN
jgi:hypothetical protein